MNEHERTHQPVRRLLMAGTLFLVLLPVLTLVGLGMVYSARASAQDQHNRSLRTANGIPIAVKQNQPNSGWEDHQSIRVDLDPALGRRYREAYREGASRLSRNRDQRRLDPVVGKLVQSIQSVDDNQTDAREEKTEELRKLLNNEFAQMHEAQGAEIAKTQERLDALKRVHAQRDQQKDAIVQRRINNLLGEPDELAWTAESLDRNIRSRIGDRDSNQRIIHLGAQRPPDRSIAPRSPRSPAAPVPAKAGVVPAVPVPGKAGVVPAVPATILRANPTDKSSFDNQSENRRALALNEIFQLARSAAHAFSESKILELKQRRLEKFRGELSESDIQDLTRQKQQLALQTQLYRQQIEAMQSRLTSEAKFAKELMENVMDNLKIQEQRFRSGELGQGALLEVQRTKLEAQKRVSDAQSVLDHFRQVLGELEEIEFEFDDEEIHETEIEDNTFGEAEIEHTRSDADDQEEATNDSGREEEAADE